MRGCADPRPGARMAAPLITISMISDFLDPTAIARMAFSRGAADLTCRLVVANNPGFHG
jgi:hypothetical protein